MMQSIKKYWIRYWNLLGELGVDDKQEAWVNKRVRLTNHFTACIIIIASSYVFGFYAFDVKILPWITVIAALSFIPVIFLNNARRYFTARLTFVFLINNWVLFYCFCIGPDTNMHMIFFGLACCPWLLFDTKNWIYILLCVWFSFAEFYTFILLNPEPILPLSEELNSYIALSFYGVVFLLAMLSVGFLSIENSKSESKLEESNKHLKALFLEVKETNNKLKEQLALEQQNNELQSALAYKEKINSQLERFTYMVAHDLKSPIYGSKGLLDLIQFELESGQTENLKEYADLMEKALIHLGAMINSILEYSRMTHTEHPIEEVDVHLLVEEITHLLFPPSHVHITIKNQLPKIRCNKVKLLQVFQNLISNAIKYNDKEEIDVEIGLDEEFEDYRFYVKDNGSGIEPTDFKRLFGLFDTIKNNSVLDQTGIGLNIMKVLVEEQGGKIYVESIPGNGSTFSFDWYDIKV